MPILTLTDQKLQKYYKVFYNNLGITILFILQISTHQFHDVGHDQLGNIFFGIFSLIIFLSTILMFFCFYKSSRKLGVETLQLPELEKNTLLEKYKLRSIRSSAITGIFLVMYGISFWYRYDGNSNVFTALFSGLFVLLGAISSFYYTFKLLDHAENLI